MKRYINEFVRLSCASDILALKLFPNAKEITESMAAYQAVRSHIVGKHSYEFGNSDIAVVCVGDGHTPRTAALFAFRTAWTCYSVDPRMRKTEWDIKRLLCYDNMIEDITLDLRHYRYAILLMVHSHAELDVTIQHIMAKHLHVVAIPCCVPMEIPGKCYIGYQDLNIWSPQNTVKVWHDVRTDSC